MRIDLVRRTVLNINPPSIGLPSRNTRRKPVVGVGDAPVMLLTKFVFLGVRSRIAPQPEILDERLPLVVGLQRLKNLPLLVRDYVADLFVQPPLIRCLQ